jgi:hypothetical protein
MATKCANFEVTCMEPGAASTTPAQRASWSISKHKYFYRRSFSNLSSSSPGSLSTSISTTINAAVPRVASSAPSATN